MASIQVGIVGCGKIADRTHIPVYTSLDAISSISICDTDESRLSKFKHEHPINSSYTNILTMLEDESLDFVDICVPPRAHKDVALTALEHNCHIFVEKPLAPTSQECEEIIQSSEKNNKFVGVMHNKRFNKPFLEAKRRIESGEIGDVLRLHLLSLNPKSEMLNQKDHWYHNLPGGVMGETLPHLIYMTRDLAGNIESVDIHAQNMTNTGWAANDEFEIIFETSNVLCSATLSYASNIRASQVTIVGTDGVLEVNLTTNEVMKYQLTDLDYKELGKNSVSNIYQQSKNVVSNILDVVLGNAEVGSDILLKRYVESIQSGTEPPVTGLDGLAVVKTMDEVVDAYESQI